MAVVRSRSQRRVRGYKTRDGINRTMQPAKPRDDLRGAFGGEENRANKGKRVKDRKLPADAEKTPKL